MAEYRGFARPIMVGSRIRISDDHGYRGQTGTVVRISDNRVFTYVDLDSGKRNEGIPMRYLIKLADPPMFTEPPMTIRPGSW
jgi:hypothetical protein